MKRQIGLNTHIKLQNLFSSKYKQTPLTYGFILHISYSLNSRWDRPIGHKKWGSLTTYCVCKTFCELMYNTLWLLCATFHHIWLCFLHIVQSNLLTLKFLSYNPTLKHRESLDKSTHGTFSVEMFHFSPIGCWFLGGG